MNKGVNFQELHGVCCADPWSCPCSVPASKSRHMFDFKNNGPHLWTHRVLSLSLKLTRVSIPKRGLGMRVFKRDESTTLPSLFFYVSQGSVTITDIQNHLHMHEKWVTTHVKREHTTDWTLDRGQNGMPTILLFLHFQHLALRMEMDLIYVKDLSIYWNS